MFNKIRYLFSNSDEFLNEFNFPLTIKRSDRRTISLIVRDGKLLVRCPTFSLDKKIYDLIAQKKNWIKKNIDKQNQNFRISNEMYFQKKIFLFKGFQKKLHLQNSNQEYIYLTKDKIVISGKNLNTNAIKVLLNNWYKNYSYDYFEQKLIFYSKKMNLITNKLIIREYKTKWGLCSFRKKIIYLNWRLVMAPESVLDYVIIHELCHLIEPNHSKSFWNQVEKYKSDYKKDKMWLKENGFLLFF